MRLRAAQPFYVVRYYLSIRFGLTYVTSSLLRSKCIDNKARSNQNKDTGGISYLELIPLVPTGNTVTVKAVSIRPNDFSCLFLLIKQIYSIIKQRFHDIWGNLSSIIYANNLLIVNMQSNHRNVFLLLFVNNVVMKNLRVCFEFLKFYPYMYNLPLRH